MNISSLKYPLGVIWKQKTVHEVSRGLRWMGSLLRALDPIQRAVSPSLQPLLVLIYDLHNLNPSYHRSTAARSLYVSFFVGVVNGIKIESPLPVLNDVIMS